MDTVIDALTNPELRMDERVMLAWLWAQADREEGHYPRTEDELAIHVGMSPHAVRQAIIGLRRHGLVRREYMSLGGTRPVAIFGIDTVWIAV